MMRVLWIFIVLVADAEPALCRGGLLQHICACLDASAECGHEAACPDDPCAWMDNQSARTATASASAPPVLAIDAFASPSIPPDDFRPLRALELRVTPLRRAHSATVVLRV